MLPTRVGSPVDLDIKRSIPLSPLLSSVFYLTFRYDQEQIYKELNAVSFKRRLTNILLLKEIQIFLVCFPSVSFHLVEQQRQNKEIMWICSWLSQKQTCVEVNVAGLSLVSALYSILSPFKSICIRLNP